MLYILIFLIVLVIVLIVDNIRLRDEHKNLRNFCMTGKDQYE